MKPPPFDYHAPRTLAEALDLLANLGPEAKPLAGGQSLVPLMNFRLARPAHLIDLNRLPGLSYLEPHDGGLAIGAMTRHRDLERSTIVLSRCPLLAQAAAQIGHLAIRSRGTVGGSLAHADPAAELPAALLLLDGRVTLASRRGSRTVAAADFFVDLMTTAAEPDELLTEVWFPEHQRGSRQAWLELTRRHGDFAVVGVGVSLSAGLDGTAPDARIVLFGVGPTPVRARAAEAGLLAGERDAEVAAIAAREIDPATDIHATTEYRREAAEVLVRRALAAAWDEIGLHQLPATDRPAADPGARS